MLFALVGTAMAQTTDVPKDHWAYNAVQELVSKGYVTSYPDGTFMGNRTLTRYEFATVVKRILDNIDGRLESQPTQTAPAAASTPETTPAASGMSSEDAAQISKLVAEFKVELTVIGTRMDKVEAEMADIKSRFGTVEAIVTDPEGAFRATKSDVSKLKKIGLSGYLQTRYEKFADKADGSGQQDEDGKATNNSFNIRRARLKLSAKPTNFVTGVIQLDAGANTTSVKEAYIDYNFKGNPDSPVMTIGQQVWPFGYENVYSSAKRETPEQALWERRFFQGEYDRGLKVATPFNKDWLLQVGLFDGTGIGTVNSFQKFATTPAVSMKTSATVGKDYDTFKDTIANLQYNGDKYEFGLSSYLGNCVWDANREKTIQTVTKTRYGADFRYFLNNFTIKGEYVRARGIDGAVFAGYDQKRWIDGWDGQLNYNLGKDNTLVTRYETLSFDPLVTTNYGHRSSMQYGIIHWLDDKTRIKLFYQNNMEELNKFDNNIWRAEWIMTY